MLAAPSPSLGARPAATESFDDFRYLGIHEVRRRAEEAEARPVHNVGTPSPCATAAWRRLYREMRRRRAAIVADLGRRDLERHASRLGYGYFRVRVNSGDAFLPLPR